MSILTEVHTHEILFQVQISDTDNLYVHEDMRIMPIYFIHIYKNGSLRYPRGEPDKAKK